jgi:hypothetical protein
MQRVTGTFGCVQVSYFLQPCVPQSSLLNRREERAHTRRMFTLYM